MQATLEDKRVSVRQIPDIPPLPAIGQMILAELGRDEVHIGRLARMIEQDPGLMARIVGVANSAYFGCKDRISRVSDAIVKVLGLNMVKSLAFSIVLSSPLRAGDCRGFQLDRYWYTAMLVSNLARRLAQRTHGRDREFVDLAFLCGLLHNFGELVLVYAYPVEFSAVLSELSLEEGAVARRELEVVGVTRQQAGAALGRKWHLPAAVVSVMEHHLEPEYRGDHWEVSALVGMCARMAALDHHDQECQPDERYLQALRLSADSVMEVCDQVRDYKQEIRDMAQLLALD